MFVGRSVSHPYRRYGRTQYKTDALAIDTVVEGWLRHADPDYVTAYSTPEMPPVMAKLVRQRLATGADAGDQ